MQLTRYTDYGLRILTYLALLPEGSEPVWRRSASSMTSAAIT